MSVFVFQCLVYLSCNMIRLNRVLYPLNPFFVRSNVTPASCFYRWFRLGLFHTQSTLPTPKKQNKKQNKKNPQSSQHVVQFCPLINREARTQQRPRVWTTRQDQLWEVNTEDLLKTTNTIQNKGLTINFDAHSEHRLPAHSSKLCQNWLRHWRPGHFIYIFF